MVHLQDFGTSVTHHPDYSTLYNKTWVRYAGYTHTHTHTIRTPLIHSLDIGYFLRF